MNGLDLFQGKVRSGILSSEECKRKNEEQYKIYCVNGKYVPGLSAATVESLVIFGLNIV